jgi:hypothetical protein
MISRTFRCSTGPTPFLRSYEPEVMSDDLEQRIRGRAYRLWVEEGQPQGKAEAHWELARIAIALEDAKPQMQRPVAGPTAEPVDAWVNQGEFPTLTDQGEQHAPGERGDAGS